MKGIKNFQILIEEFIIIIMLRSIQAYKYKEFYDINFVYKKNSLFPLSNSEFMLINNVKIAKFQPSLQESSSYYYINSFSGLKGMSSLLDKENKVYYVSGLKKQKKENVILFASIDFRGNIKSIEELKEINEDTVLGLSKVNETKYFITYYFNNFIYIWEYDIITKKFKMLWSLYYSGNQQTLYSFKCSIIFSVTRVVCSLVELGKTNSAKIYLINDKFTLVPSFPKTLDLLGSSVSETRIITLNYEEAILSFIGEDSLMIYLIKSNVSEYDNIEILLTLSLSDIIPKSNSILPLGNEGLLIIYYRLNDKSQKVCIKMFDIRKKKFVFDFINKKSPPESSQLLLGGLSPDFDKIIFLGSKDSNIKEFEVDIIQTSSVVINIFGYSPTTLTLDKFYSGGKYYENVFIAFFDTQNINKNKFVLEGIGKGEESYSEVVEGKFYRSLRYQYSGGKLQFKLKYFLYKYDNFLQPIYEPSLGYSNVSFKFICYPTCYDCIDKGYVNNHKCKNCKEGYTLLSQTPNCVPKKYKHHITKRNRITSVSCHEFCESCSTVPVPGNTKCDRCISRKKDVFEYSNNLENKGNCTDPCDLNKNYWYINETNFICRNKSEKCPLEFPYLNERKGECVKFPNRSDQKANVLISSFDDFFSLINEDPNILKKLGPIMTDTFSVNFDNNLNVNESFSRINLTQCMDKLRKEYNLLEEEILKVLVIDIYREVLNQVEYSIYTSSMDQLDLNVCKEEEVVIESKMRPNSVINITLVKELKHEEKYKAINLFRADDRLFNDYCFSFSTTDKKDVIIKDRRKYFFQNLSLETTCITNDFDPDELIFNYSCMVKTAMSDKERGKNFNENYFPKEIESSNLKYFLCYKAFIVPTGFKNPGTIFCLIILGIHLVNFWYYLLMDDKFTDSNLRGYCPPPKKGNVIIYGDSVGEVRDSKYGDWKKSFTDTLEEFPIISEQKTEDVIDLEYIENHNENFDYIESKIVYVDSGNESEGMRHSNQTKSQEIHEMQELEDIIEEQDINESNETINQALILSKNMSITKGLLRKRKKLKKKDKRLEKIKLRFSYNLETMIRRKHPLVLTFCQKVPKLIRCLRISKFFHTISFIFLFNALLYSEDAVSRKLYDKTYIFWSHFLLIFFSVFFSMILRLLLHFFFSYTYFLDKFYKIDKDYELYIKNFKRKLRFGCIVFFILQLICIYYVTVFLNIFVCYRYMWIINSLISVLIWTIFNLYNIVAIASLARISDYYDNDFLFRIALFLFK